MATGESLWLGRIDPLRSTASLSQDELSLLGTVIVKVLTEGFALRNAICLAAKGKRSTVAMSLNEPGDRVCAAKLPSQIYELVGGILITAHNASADLAFVR